jgi:serine/threonine protein kinase/WD40 repeat protein
LSEGFGALAGLRVGSVIAGYQLEEQVGAGGMAAVFRARDLRLGRLVALKVLVPGLAADEGFRRRFVAESRAAAAVDDPHIVPVYEAGEADGVLFIAMRFVSGGDLRGVLAREGPVRPDRAAEFISPVASALDAAHRAGLVHRDVKPANVLVDAHQGRPDHVYLSDFGVSKGAMSSASLTGPGQFVGTSHYAAPEQVLGQVVDGRADQYALACVTWQLLTGAVPFERDQEMAVLLAHLSEPPPPLSARRPDLPAAADAVLARALAKEPAQRYVSCREFADALRDALGVAPYAAAVSAVPEPGPVTTRAVTVMTDVDSAGMNSPPGHTDAVATVRYTEPTPGPDDYGVPRSRRRRPLYLLMIALAAVLVAAVAVPLALAKTWARTPQLSGSLTATLTDPDGRLMSALAFAPRGTTLAVGDYDGNTYLWDTATRKVTATLTDPTGGGVSALAFAPDGTTLAAADNDSTYLWNTATRKVTATLTDPNGDGVSALAFAPRGTTLAAADINDSIYLWDTATGKVTATLTDPNGDGVSALAFAPDGTTLAAADDDGSTYLWDTATAKVTATLTDPTDPISVNAVAFGPDGTTLATGDDSGSTCLWDTATGKVTATLTDPNGHDGQGVNAVAFAPGGTTLATGSQYSNETDSQNGNIYLWDTATGGLAATLTDPDPDAGPEPNVIVAFAPGGTTLATGGAFSAYLWRLTRRNS